MTKPHLWIHADGGPADAARFARTHVVIRKRDIKRIGDLARRLGFYRKLKALGIQIHEIAMGGDIE